jgi:hypothetical protein
MNMTMKVQVSLSATLLILAGCASTQAPEKTNATIASPVQEVAESTTASNVKVAVPAVVKVDHYTVVKGDTLAKIAARPEVYGNKNMWHALYEANRSQIKPGGLIFPNQVLNVDRSLAETNVNMHRPKDKGGEQPQVASSSYMKVGSDYLEAARRAYEAGDMSWTLYYYHTYLASHPRNGEVWGELGNVYYGQGAMPEAAQCYYNSANLLIDKGQTKRALMLMPAIQEGNPELADLINGRLTRVNQ